MPVYEYEHTHSSCRLGRIFEVVQSIKDPDLRKCPQCQQPVNKLISLVGIAVSKSNSELRDLGFTKLVKRDDGVYENVTARDGDSKYMRRGEDNTIPNVSKIVTD
jgi:putative FmdB family regulatory protein